MLKNQIKLYAIMTAILVALLGQSYVTFFEKQKDEMIYNKYNEFAFAIKKNLSTTIEQKEKATMALALSLVNDIDLANRLHNKQIPKHYFKPLINNYKTDTLYKNIWINIINKDYKSICRSWTHLHGDNLSTRKDLQYVMKNNKPLSSIGINKYDLVIKAIVPITLKGKVIGALEMLSHFNSIAQKLIENGIEPVLLLDPSYKEKILYPFTNTFIDSYYVALKNASQPLLQYLQEHGIKNYWKDGYKLENSKLIISYPLINYAHATYGYFIISKNSNSLAKLEDEFFIFQKTMIGGIVILSLLIVLGFYMYLHIRRQKLYYQNIIDSSTNIVLIQHQERFIDANKRFFSYFTKCQSIEDFHFIHVSLEKLFVDEEGYLCKKMGEKSWFEYLKETNQASKVKMQIYKKDFYFNISISKIMADEDKYTVILSDITEEELSKKELEKLTITDPLTHIKNRRYFERKLHDEMVRSSRYKEKLSLVMFDIDHFKKVNDEHGHDIGDSVLKEYTSFISSHLRTTDIFCRIGGEEFIIIFPHISRDMAIIIVEKLRQAIEEHKKVLPITMSFGVVEYDQIENQETLFKRVDTALYRAKETGRNKVVMG